MRPAHARARATRPGGSLGPWFWLGVVLAAAGAAGLVTGLAAGTLPLVPASVARLVERASRPVLLAGAGVLGALAVAAGLALAWPRRPALVTAPPVELLELPARLGRGHTRVRAPALTSAGAADVAAMAGVVGARLELVGDRHAPVVRAAVEFDQGADLLAVRAAVTGALGRLATTAGRPVEAAEVVLRLAGERDQLEAGNGGHG